MIEFTINAHLFCILLGLSVYICLMILVLTTAFVKMKLRIVGLLKSRQFVFATITCLILFPSLCWLSWWSYSSYLLHSTIKKLENCTSVKLTAVPNLAYVLADTPDYSFSSKLSMNDDVIIKEPYVIVVTDSESTQLLASSIGKNIYRVKDPGSIIATHYGTFISILRDDTEIGNFTILGDNNLAIGKFGSFYSQSNLQKQIYRALPETQQIALRVKCADNLGTLKLNLDSFFAYNNSYPDKNWWCDLLLAEAIKRKVSFADIDPSVFTCEAAGEGPSHYAMNPYCEPNSPKDVVLLFETDAGWNQHGGPELMVFDHHEPPGCNVLLNDGTVLFITPDRADTLNWGTDINSPAVKEE